MIREPSPTGAHRFHRAVAERHYHDHRFRFALRDQVVEDHVGESNRRPSAGVVAEAVQQIENGISFFRRGIVARRSVDVKVALIVGHCRLVEVMMDFSARNVADFPWQPRAGNMHRVRRGEQVRHQQSVVGIEHAHAVDEDGVSVVVGSERGRGQVPHALIVFLHRHWIGAGTRQLHFLRVRSEEAEGHTVVRVDFRSHQPRRPLRSGGLRGRRLWCLRWRALLRGRQTTKNGEKQNKKG
jgi:hypothetical protein